MTRIIDGPDVNTQFDGQRAQQIADYVNNQATQADRVAAAERRVASGELADMGGGAYRVMTGWDRGEIFNFGAQGLLMPQAGLDLNAEGKALGYFAQPEWHALGTVIEGGTTDIDKILEVSGGNYTVDKRPARYFGSDGELRVHEDGYITVRDDTNASLGMVGSRWTCFQNDQAFGFLSEVLGQKELLPVSAFPLRGGRRFIIALRLPEDVHLDVQGVDEVIRPYVCAYNSFDGKTPFRCTVTPWRPRCSNTERLSLRDAITTWKVPHFKNGLAKIEEAQKTLGLTVTYYQEFAKEEQALIQTELTQAQASKAIDELLAELWADEDKPKPELTKREAGTRDRRADAVREIAAVEYSRTGRNAYSVERAFTDYLDHVAPHRVKGLPNGAAMATAIMEGTEDERKGTAHRKLMTLTTR